MVVVSMEEYLEKYYELIQSFYNANKQKINADKTQLCLNAPTQQICHFRKFNFVANGYLIKNLNKIKIMETYINYNLTIDNHLNSLVSKCYNITNNLKK